MNLIFPEFEKDRYESILNKKIDWLESYLHSEYKHIHSNGTIENKEEYLKNISSEDIQFKEMKPLNWEVRENSDFIFITGISNFKLIYFKRFLDLELAYHSIWQIDLQTKCFSWQATKVKLQTQFKA